MDRSSPPCRRPGSAMTGAAVTDLGPVGGHSHHPASPHRRIAVSDGPGSELAPRPLRQPVGHHRLPCGMERPFSRRSLFHGAAMTIAVRPINPGRGTRAVENGAGLRRIAWLPRQADSDGGRSGAGAVCARAHRRLPARLLRLAIPPGCAFWHRSFATSRGREVIYLEDLSVLPEYRRKGVARALLKALAAEARRRRLVPASIG